MAKLITETDLDLSCLPLLVTEGDLNDLSISAHQHADQDELERIEFMLRNNPLLYAVNQDGLLLEVMLDMDGDSPIVTPLALNVDGELQPAWKLLYCIDSQSGQAYYYPSSAARDAARQADSGRAFNLLVPYIAAPASHQYDALLVNAIRSDLSGQGVALIKPKYVDDIAADIDDHPI